MLLCCTGMQPLVRANSVNSSSLPGNRQVSGFRTLRHHSRQMFQVLVSYQLIRCQVSHPFLSVYLSIITYPFFSLLSITPLGGGGSKGLCGPFCLTVRDSRTGLWVTESSCVVDGLFVGQRVQECSCARRLSAGPGRTHDPLCQFDGSVALFFADLKRSEV